MADIARRKSITVKEEDEFKSVLDEISDAVMSHPAYSEIDDAVEWVKQVIDYNVPNGKQIRGKAVIATYMALVPAPKTEEMKLVYALAWCVELTCFLIADDIMDNSETRRGTICWYLLDDVGSEAINDAFILKGLFFFVLDKFLCHHESYNAMVDLFEDIFMKTSLGQSMDTLISRDKRIDDFKMMEYQYICQYKTSYYSFYLPVACAMLLSGKSDYCTSIQKICLDIGLLFQVQDDYLDCFGDPAETGNIGTDIAENKCSWLINMAFDKANSRQKAVLMENYGNGKQTSPENIRQVMKVYKQLKIQKEYNAYETFSYDGVCKEISRLPPHIPQSIFQETLDIIYKRRK